MTQRADTKFHDDRTLPSLTGIRFFAALAVFVSHYTALGLIDLPQGFIDFLDGGRTAVTLFFVISGFVLTYNYEQLTGIADARKFWINRFARIYPGLALGILLGCAGMAVALHSGAGRLLDWYSLSGADKAAMLVSLGAQLSMTTAWFPFARINQPWNGPAWSVACEVLFYAAFPMLIVLLRRRTPGRLLGIALFGFLGQGCLIIALNEFFGSRSGFLVSQFPITHLFEFVAGIIAALWFQHGGGDWLRIGSRRSVAILLSTAALITLSLARPVNPAYYLMTPAFVLLVLGLATPTERLTILGRKSFLVLGEASYSLYITHVPIGHLLEAANLPTAIQYVASVAVIGLSVIIFQTYETGARRWIKKKLLPNYSNLSGSEGKRRAQRSARS